MGDDPVRQPLLPEVPAVRDRHAIAAYRQLSAPGSSGRRMGTWFSRMGLSWQNAVLEAAQVVLHEVGSARMIQARLASSSSGCTCRLIASRSRLRLRQLGEDGRQRAHHAIGVFHFAAAARLLVCGCQAQPVARMPLALPVVVLGYLVVLHLGARLVAEDAGAPIQNAPCRENSRRCAARSSPRRRARTPPCAASGRRAPETAARPRAAPRRPTPARIALARYRHPTRPRSSQLPGCPGILAQRHPSKLQP